MNKIARILSNKPFVIALAATTSLSANAGITADSLAQQIVNSNPALKIMQQRSEATYLADKDENTLAAPEIEFTHQWGMKGIGNKWSADIKQSFDWPGLYSARAKANDARKIAANQEYAVAYADTYRQTVDLIDDIVYCNKQLDVLQTMHKTLKEQADNVHEGYKLGELSILDVKKADFELFSLSNKIADTLTQLNEAKSALETLAGQSINITNLCDYPSLSLLPAAHYIEESALLNNKAQLAHSGAQASMLEAKAAKMSRMPGFSIGYGYEYEMGERFNGLSLGLTLPFLSGKNKQKAATLMAESYNLEAKAEIETDKNEILTLHLQATTLKQRIDDSQQLFSANNDYLWLLNEAYKGGEMNVINYLTEVNYYLDASIEYLDTEYRYNKILNQLNNRYMKN